jgi:hypothetical protein
LTDRDLLRRLPEAELAALGPADGPVAPGGLLG